eukprot:TRINITY_DN65039_c0_g1_i1.p3 TRINITY_DN65039_c0_g1~~TRINITY_DN65039_c0_g1_i1.p3  ORF type:complete len:113 (+),score=21.59 TRINITY_DN65039_c0_g1_i1:164-502(+)
MCIRDREHTYAIQRNVKMTAMIIYNIGIARTLANQDVEALESYRTCQWLLQQQKAIFKRAPYSLVERFVELSSREEEVTINLLQMQEKNKNCLLYTSPSPRDLSTSRMPSSA